jgi:hypothetical protein
LFVFALYAFDFFSRKNSYKCFKIHYFYYRSAGDGTPRLCACQAKALLPEPLAQPKDSVLQE